MNPAVARPHVPQPETLPAVFDPELVKRFSFSGPRYTSYPTADRFHEAFDVSRYGQALAGRAIGAMRQPLSLYLHLPFCNTVCFYCACNKVVTGDRNKSAKYVHYLGSEMRMQAALLGDDRRVSSMHWGGGTPTFMNEHELRVLMDMLRETFDFDPAGEYAIEIDPRTAGPEMLKLLAELGFNRTSFGVQDFDPVVQKAVNRIQSHEETKASIDAARGAGMRSVNVDLIYGLPKQNHTSFAKTIDQILGLRPDRIALYNYAHLPSRFKPQTRIHEVDLPSPAEKLAILSHAIEAFNQAGYVYIGMDHFALPGDDLAKAQRRGTLTRNFQGYSANPDGDIMAMGVSAIGKIGATYSQNDRDLKGYYETLDQGRIPIVRGLELTADDLVRRAVIQGLMCQFLLPIETIESAHLIDFRKYFAAEMTALQEFVGMGLVDIEDEWIAVTPRGRFFVRAVCAVFDKYLRAGQQTKSYSRII
jgi:oxygen-independent coproporphyrinogen-3 oxidase